MPVVLRCRDCSEAREKYHYSGRSKRKSVWANSPNFVHLRLLLAAQRQASHLPGNYRKTSRRALHSELYRRGVGTMLVLYHKTLVRGRIIRGKDKFCDIDIRTENFGFRFTYGHEDFCQDNLCFDSCSARHAIQESAQANQSAASRASRKFSSRNRSLTISTVNFTD